MKKITIKEIAREAGVSVGTVDRVLHNRGDVAQATKDLVMKIAEEGNYTTNVFARTLKLNKTFRISIIIPQDNEYWLAQREGIEKAGSEYDSLGMQISFYKFERNDKDSFVKQSKKIIQSKPDGVVMAPLIENEARDICTQLNELQIPFVFVDSNLQDMKPLAFVGQNTVQSGVLSAKLLNYGCAEGQKTWILKYSDYDIWNKTVKERIEGFYSYYDTKGWSRDLIHEAELDDESDLSYIIGIANNGEVVRIFVPNSRAYQVMDLLRKKGLKKDIRLAGYDQTSQNIRELQSSAIDFIINQNPIQQGYLSIQSLYRHLIVHTDVEPYQYMPVEIVTKENVDYANVFYL